MFSNALKELILSPEAGSEAEEINQAQAYGTFGIFCRFPGRRPQCFESIFRPDYTGFMLKAEAGRLKCVSGIFTASIFLRL